MSFLLILSGILQMISSLILCCALSNVSGLGYTILRRTQIIRISMQESKWSCEALLEPDLWSVGIRLFWMLNINFLQEIIIEIFQDRKKK